MTTRREFLQSAGLAAGSAATIAGGAAGARREAGKRVRIAVPGGGFGCSFQWHEHPNCEVAAAAVRYPSRRAALRETYGCKDVYDSLVVMLKRRARDLDAAAVFSGAPNHVKHTPMCFDRSLHVISAVPACMNLDDAGRLRDAKKKTGLGYMMAETSYYRGGCIHVRESYRKGGMGEIFCSEVEYYPGLFRRFKVERG